jgi:antitoxin (DNA-binding transcriptional repressor) of toxin-antitoxin stability system
VTIAKAGHPVARLIPIGAEKLVLGSARGLVTRKPGWDEPMTPEEVEETFGR